MNITFVNRMMGIKFGGGENFDLNMARALKRRGHNIQFVIGREWKKISLPMDENEFEVVYIKTPYLRDLHYNVAPTNIINRVISAGALEIDLRLFENGAYKFLKNDSWSDVYQLCGLSRLGYMLEKIGKKSSVRWPGPPSKSKLKFIEQCSCNFANGDAFRQISQNLYPKVKNINLGIDINKFYPKRKENNRVNFLFVGRVVPIKNLSFMVKAFIEVLKVNDDIVLNIVGDGEEQEIKRIKDLIPLPYSEYIKFLGKKSGDDLLAQYQNSDVFIITSSYDNYPNVVFEAMACGLPVIGTDVGGIPLQITDRKTGILVELNNIEDLKNSILELVQNKKLRIDMGITSREKILNEFSWDKSADSLEKLYMGICQ